MCVAIVVPNGAENPGHDEMLDAQYVNSDGLGMAWVNKGKVEYEKGLSITACEHLMHQVKKPYILHFRLATAGGNDMTMCHPFPVDHTATPKLKGKATMVLFHNGHVEAWKEMLLNLIISRRMRMLEGDVSDSRVCAVFAKKVGCDGLNLIEHNRFATLNNKGEVNLYGNWERKNGRIYSNTNHFWNTAGVRGPEKYGKYVAENASRYTVFTPSEKKSFEVEDKIERKGTGFGEYIRIDRIIAANVNREKARANLALETQWERDEIYSSGGWDSVSRVAITGNTATTILSDPDDRPGERMINKACDEHHLFMYGCPRCEMLNGMSRDYEAPTHPIRRKGVK